MRIPLFLGVFTTLGLCQGSPLTETTQGVLITGGINLAVSNTAELYVPSSGASCTLPSLPNNRAWHTVTEGGLLCGGWYDTANSCIQWYPDSGTWKKKRFLSVERWAHVSWTPTSGNTTLMGGGSTRGRKTTTLIPPGGSQKAGFRLKYEDSSSRYEAYKACAIADPVTDTIVVTGGTDRYYNTYRWVIRYGEQGYLSDLQPLITARYGHACSRFISAGGRPMFLVTGGSDGSNYLDSTETYDPLRGSWFHSRAKLPRPMFGLRAENIFLFGGSDGDDYYDDILEYDPEEDTITSVGHMTQARSLHAISAVPAADYLQWCDGSM